MSDPIAMAAASAVLLQPTPAELPAPIRWWLESSNVPLVTVRSAEDVMTLALRSRPRFVIADARGAGATMVLDGCRRLKSDSYTGIVPVTVLTDDVSADVAAALDAGADESVPASAPPIEVEARLRAMLARSDRDVEVHPSTRLPGAPAIQRAIAARMNGPFAVCYADLDHFKEFNDRYSYTEGDRVIRILAMLLHDVVVGLCGTRGFVGHIGGDDFIFIVPRAQVEEVCHIIVSTFDTLIVYQYSEHDRRAGYFFGKDRRGQLHRVPLMTLSIGVVTNERRTFADAKTVSDLATEMKTYAKTLSGSVYAVDRRTDDRSQLLPVPQLMGIDSRQ